MSKACPSIEPHRFKTALCLRRKTLSEVATAAKASLRHVVYVIHGERPGSDRVYQALRAALGDAGWAFATGQTDALHDEGGDDAAA